MASKNLLYMWHGPVCGKTCLNRTGYQTMLCLWWCLQHTPVRAVKSVTTHMVLQMTQGLKMSGSNVPIATTGSMRHAQKRLGCLRREITSCVHGAYRKSLTAARFPWKLVVNRRYDIQFYRLSTAYHINELSNQCGNKHAFHRATLCHISKCIW